jgi:hypothetical protein
MMAKAKRLLTRIWGFARELLGDDAYARYRVHVAARGGTPLNSQEFYLAELQRKYSRPSRCC